MFWLPTILIVNIIVQCFTSENVNCDIGKSKSCEAPRPLEPHEPSIFIIKAAGRLGNHLMAFAIVMTLAKTLKIRPFVEGETARYLRQYFLSENIPVVEETFCNPDAIPGELFDEDLNYLVEHTELHRGRILYLWPWGYKEDSPVCCPADELMTYVSKHNMAEVRNALQFKEPYLDHVALVKKNISETLKTPLEDITFIGIHNRRTDHLKYFKEKFNKKPLKKSYFKNAMQHFRDECETPKIAFLFISDDMEWGRSELKSVSKKFGDLFFVGIGKEHPEAIGYDLALMANTDHMIISRGSFSSWCAILSGGEYFTEWGLIVPLRQFIEQQDKSKRRKKKKHKKKP